MCRVGGVKCFKEFHFTMIFEMKIPGKITDKDTGGLP